MSGHAFVGTGWRWPVQTDATGEFALTGGTTLLEQAMYLVLATTPGERPMRPEFGARLRAFVFESGDATTAGRIAAEVRSALTRWEPRVEVGEVVVTVDADDPSTLWIDVAYAVRSTNDRRNLVFPFYVIARHEQDADHRTRGTDGRTDGHVPALLPALVPALVPAVVPGADGRTS